MQTSKTRFITTILAAAGLALVLVGCSTKLEHRGYMPKPGAFDQITDGMTKMEVEGIMGTPSTTASVQYKGDSFYYISQITEQKAFMTTETDRTVTEKLAQAQKEAQIVRGQGDAERNKVFAEAFQQDPEFFSFYRSMQAYRNSLGADGTTMVLNPDSEFFRYFGDQKPGEAAIPPAPAPAQPAQ